MSAAALLAPGAEIGLPIGLALAGVGLIRFAWRRPKPGAASLGGWALIAAAAPAWALSAAPDKAVALALLAPTPIALGFLVAAARVRPASTRRERAAVELPDRSGDAAWRGWTRAVLAGPVAGPAALALSAGWMLHGPGSEADRLGFALLGAPALWAAGLIWATTDPRLVRIGAGLGALAVLGGLWARL